MGRPLDLAAMALTPDDLAAAGLPGFGQHASALVATEEQAERVAPDLGRDPAVVRDALADAGFRRRYERQLLLGARPGARPSRLRAFVAPYVLEYASAEGAADGFGLLEAEDPGGPNRDVPGARRLGDRSEVTRFDRVADGGEPYRALDLTFRVGRLVAGVTVGEYGDREPDLATVEALGERLLAKVRAGEAGGGPGLSNRALRLGGPGVETRADEYGRLGGRTFPDHGETAEELAARAARYGDATDVYGVGQGIAAGGAARGDDVRSFALLHRFGDEQAASGWLRGGVERARATPYLGFATQVPGAATVGDESLTLAVEAPPGPAGTASGFLVAARVGAEVAQVQLLGVPGVPLAAVEALARAQVACLRAGACLDPVPVPAGLPPLEPPAPVASPAAGGPEGTLDPCGPPGPAGATPAAVGDPPPAAPQPAFPVPAAGAARPNIVLVLTDDLDARSVACLPTVRALLADQGLTFANAFATTPVCCPARASVLRGQYAHNHGVLNNAGEDGGFPAFHRLGNEESTVATWLQAAGYRTALFGKYLNRYPRGASPTHVPPGWDAWAAFVSADDGDRGGAFFTDYALNEDGALVAYGDRPADYSTDVLAAEAAGFVARASDAGEPFFLYLAPYAPHGPSTPAPRHAGAFAGARAPRVPSFDEADVGDKPAWVRAMPALGDEQAALVDDRHRRRLRSLLAVDEMVGTLVGALAAAGTLDDTYVVFTSDNGFHLGEHRLPLGKHSPYEESIRVPLIVRGPGVPAGSVADLPVLNTDLAPTFAELAGAAAPEFVDGRSLAPLLRGEAPPGWRRGFLVEHLGKAGVEGHAAPGSGEAAGPATEPEEGDGEESISPADAPPYLALRTTRYLYVEYAGGERELYDLRADPFQLRNLAATADPALLARLSRALAELGGCAADGCRSAEDALPDP